MMTGSLSLCEHELMCRMIEAATGEPRPANMTAKEALERMIDPETREVFSKLTRVATLYIIERAGAVEMMPTNDVEQEYTH